MSLITIREPILSDKSEFLSAMQRSKKFHHSWVKAPLTTQEFQKHLENYLPLDQKSYLVMLDRELIAGVFNMSGIVRQLFQNAYLGHYAVSKHALKGYMRKRLKLILNEVFATLNLH